MCTHKWGLVPNSYRCGGSNKCRKLIQDVCVGLYAAYCTILKSHFDVCSNIGLLFHLLQIVYLPEELMMSGNHYVEHVSAGLS